MAAKGFSDVPVAGSAVESSEAEEEEAEEEGLWRDRQTTEGR